MATKHHLFILLLFFSTICVSQEIKKHTVSAPVYQLGKELKNLINTEMDACLIDKDIDYSKMHHRLQIYKHNDSLIVHLNTGIRIIVDTEAEWGTLNITGLAVYKERTIFFEVEENLKILPEEILTKNCKEEENIMEVTFELGFNEPVCFSKYFFDGNKLKFILRGDSF